MDRQLLESELERTRYRLVEGCVWSVMKLGLVAEVEHVGTKERRRMLMLHADAPGATQLATNLRTAARRLTRFSHPNVARVLDFGVTATGRPFFVSEAVTGISLQAWLDERGLLPAVDTLLLMKDVLDALERLHTSGLSHGWLGLEHIHFERATLRGPKLTDFGVAALLRSEELDEAAIRRDVHDAGRILQAAMNAASQLRPFTNITRAIVEQANAQDEQLRFQRAPKLREALEVALVREEIALATTTMEAQPPEVQPAPQLAELADVAPPNEALATPPPSSQTALATAPSSRPPKTTQPRSIRPAPAPIRRVSAGWIILGMVVLAAIVVLMLQLSGLLF